MQLVLGMPEDKRAHRFISMNKSDFYYPPGQADNDTVININMMEGRQRETKKVLIKSLFSEIELLLKTLPIDIEITIKEQPTHCWRFRGITGDEGNYLKYKINVSQSAQASFGSYFTYSLI